MRKYAFVILGAVIISVAGLADGVNDLKRSHKIHALEARIEQLENE